MILAVERQGFWLAQDFICLTFLFRQIPSQYQDDTYKTDIAVKQETGISHTKSIKFPRVLVTVMSHGSAALETPSETNSNIRYHNGVGIFTSQFLLKYNHSEPF